MTFYLLRRVYVLMNLSFATWFLEWHFQKHLVISLIAELALQWTFFKKMTLYELPEGSEISS